MSLIGFELILCGVDFSAPSRAALAEASDLARAYQARLLVLNVVQPIVYPVEYGMMPPQLPQLETEAKANAEAALDKLIADVVGDGVTLTRRVVIGLPSRTLCDIARDESADLIVIATRGLSGLQHLMMGSTAERVVRTAPCAVLTIKGG